MDTFTAFTWGVFVIAGLLGGFVKGAVGFAMPMIMISLLSSVMAPNLALAALIVPTVLSNLWQALRGGPAAALDSLKVHWLFVTMVMAFILFSAQLVTLLPAQALYLILGVPVVLFSLAQLAGWRLDILPHQRRRAEVGIGAFAGFVGGISGVWGPPTVIYLTALDTPKAEQIRVQGVVYGMGAVMLTAAHVQSGVLNAATLPLSLWMVLPAGLGLVAGFAMQDRLDQAKFRRLTLVVLVVAGANLLRKGLMG
ncbi:sulfite exporter TauE/SafE family protein [Oceaniglobus roseus]|uniref:sulfite exporter TauE/SafE family protein n=1 Tax=Oceaniglobus roseus TaxID=1737570 RepID=UPI001FE37E8E|nr:sulfite exporter TauE/SafE family protein [Kandeliimicrobium roseum]